MMSKTLEKPSSISSKINQTQLPHGKNYDSIPIASCCIVDQNDSAFLPNVPLATAYSIPNKKQTKYNLISLNQRPFDDTYLKDLGFPTGMIKLMKDNHNLVLKRYWLIDNSGSMLENDSRRMLSMAPKLKQERRCNSNLEKRTLIQNSSSRSKPKILDCTRWSELQQCIMAHVETAAQIGINSSFKLMNKPEIYSTKYKFNVANEQDSSPEEEIKAIKDAIMETSPLKSSPLTKALREIRNEIQHLSPYLRANDKRVVVVIATDGLPTEEGKNRAEATHELMKELRTLEAFPVWIIIRLCSSDKDTVDFYQGIDNQLERNVDVITTFANEIDHIGNVNQWLNYQFPIQFCREIGIHVRLFDILNERLLTMDEMVMMCKYLFGSDTINTLPDPHIDWCGYSNGLEKLLEGETSDWEYADKSFKKWINVQVLNQVYGNSTRMSSPFKHTTSTSCNCTIM